MLHEFDERLDVVYRPETPENDDTVILFRDGDVLVRCGDPLSFPRFSECVDAVNAEQEPRSFPRFLYLFSIGERRYFTALSGFSRVPQGLETVSSYSLRKRRPITEAYAGCLAHQLAGWYRRSRYCGNCGASTVHDEKERMMRCPKCGLMVFPQICPSVIVGVIRDGKLLVTRYNPTHLMYDNGKTFRQTVHQALVAGYIESGETAEQAVRREVREETGLEVKNIRYYTSAPWPFSSSLLFGYLCEAEQGEVKADPDELSEAVFLSPEELEPRNDDVSLTSKIIEEFRIGKIR